MPIQRRNSTSSHPQPEQEVTTFKIVFKEEKEWSAIGAGELSRTPSAASSCSDAYTITRTTSFSHEERIAQNRLTGLMLERARSQSDDDRYTTEDAWAQEFEALCSC
eukprot:694911-Rhodomonas_salina.3